MDLVSPLRASLLAQSLPPPATGFLAALATARSPPPPLPSLVATARARLLACDLAAAAGLLDASQLAALPPAGAARLARDVHVQVLDVEDLARSRWEQVEALEAAARGEGTRGREVVRVAAADDEARAPTQPRRAARPGATHRLVLQDCRGRRVFAVELRRVDGIGVGPTAIGEKMVLRAGTAVARGTVLLTPETCVLLGGKIDAWHDAWADARLARLREAVGSRRPPPT